MSCGEGDWLGASLPEEVGSDILTFFASCFYFPANMETASCLPSVSEELQLHNASFTRWEPDGVMFSFFSWAFVGREICELEAAEVITQVFGKHGEK